MLNGFSPEQVATLSLAARRRSEEEMSTPAFAAAEIQTDPNLLNEMAKCLRAHGGKSLHMAEQFESLAQRIVEIKNVARSAANDAAEPHIPSVMASASPVPGDTPVQA